MTSLTLASTDQLKIVEFFGTVFLEMVSKDFKK